MVIFMPPKGSQDVLSGVILNEGEIVYNTTNKKFYTGDGITAGGKKISPEKLSELENDCGYLQSVEEQDTVFKAVSGQFADKNAVEAKNEYLLGRLAKLTKEVDTLKRAANVVITNAYNPKVVKAENGAITATDATEDVIISTDEITAPANLKVKSMDADNLSATIEYNTNNAILIDAKEDVAITNSEVESVNPMHASSNLVKVTAAEVFKLDGVKFTGTSYNTVMTGQSTSGAYIKYADILNCTFDDICSHIYIWFAGWQDEAVLNIKNCTFKSCEQVLCLGDFHGEAGVENFNNKLTVNIENCNIDAYEVGSESKADQYEGIILCDSRMTNASNFDTLNPFGNGKVIIHINNVTVGGVKLTKDNFLMGTKGLGQMLYLFRAAGSQNYSFEGNQSLFPTVYVDGELITQIQ